MKKNFDFGLIILAIVLVVVITGIAYITGYLSNNGYTQFNYLLFTQAYEILETNGLKPMPPSRSVEYQMIHGLMKAYDDPYTVFVEPVQHEMDSNQLAGKFGGIGAEIQRDANGDLRLYPYPDSPAAVAGILDGCLLVTVDNLAIHPETPIEEVISALRGEVGSTVKVTCSPSPESFPLSVEIERAEFAIPSVTWHILPEKSDIGYVKILGMSATTAQEVTLGIEDLIQQGAALFILDLRGNGGGLVDSGVEVVELFSQKGSEIITLHYPDKPDQENIARADGPYSAFPLYVFIDGSTASSAEMVAGALQASGRAEVIGAPSYGKDSIQLVFDLQDGSSIHVSAARWSLPDNPSFGTGSGIQPDLPLPSDQLTDMKYIDAVLSLAASQ